jgi:hypothetical protein
LLFVTGPENLYIFDTTFAYEPLFDDIPEFSLDIEPVTEIILRACLYDQDKRPLYNAFKKVELGDNPQIKIDLPFAQSGFNSGSKVKILRDEPPWDSFAIDTALTEMGCSAGTGVNQFYVFPSSDLSLIDLSPGADLLIISNDQPQGFYNDIFSNLHRITEFAEKGGTVLWETCDLAWNYGSYAAAGLDSLPGGIINRTLYDNMNIISDPDLNLTGGLDDTLTGFYASNKYFSGALDSAIVYMKNSGGDPTLIGCKFGYGIIIYSGQPLEYNFDRRDAYNMGSLLPRVMGFILGVSWEGSSLYSPGRFRQARLKNQPDICN